jgi:hypothetical protein
MKKILLAIAATAAMLATGPVYAGLTGPVYSPVHSGPMNNKFTYEDMKKFTPEDWICKQPYAERYAWVSIRTQSLEVMVKEGETLSLLTPVKSWNSGYREIINRFKETEYEPYLIMIQVNGYQLTNERGGTKKMLIPLRKGALSYYECAVDYDHTLDDLVPKHEGEILKVQ